MSNSMQVYHLWCFHFCLILTLLIQVFHTYDSGELKSSFAVLLFREKKKGTEKVMKYFILILLFVTHGRNIFVK